MRKLERIILKLINKYAQNKDIKPNPKLELKNDLGYTSLNFVCLIMEIEAHFDFQFEDEYLNMDKLSTIDDIIQYVNTVVPDYE